MGLCVNLKLKCKGFVFTFEAILCAFLILSFLIQLNQFESKNLDLLDVFEEQQELDRSNLFFESVDLQFETGVFQIQVAQKQNTGT